MPTDASGGLARSTDESPHDAADLGDSDDADSAVSDDAGTADVPALESWTDPVTLARFAEPRAETPTTVAVFADPHVTTDEEGTWKVYHRTADRLRAAVADANDRGVDGVVVAGDLTRDGHPAEFDGAADALADLDAPFVAVPGNHDVPKAFDDHDTPPVREFADRFVPENAVDGFPSDDSADRFGSDGFPFRARLGGVDVLGLNSASTPGGELDATHDGAISDGQRAWLERTLPETDAALVVSHHNLPGLESGLADEAYAPHPPVGDAPAFVDALAGHDALHLSGHVHLPAAISGDVRGLVCPALSSFPQAYVLLTVGPDGTAVEMVPVADEEGVSEAYELARTHSERSADICEMVGTQLSDLPLADEQ